MKNMQSIRRNFTKQLDLLSKKKNLCLLPKGNKPLLAWDLTIAQWVDESSKKILRLQEAEDDDIRLFDYGLGKSGVDYEYDDLLVVLMNTSEHVGLVLDLYKLWFIDGKSPVEVEYLLKKYEVEYNLQEAL